MSERALDRVRAWLVHPRLPLVLSLLAVALALPTLVCGLEVDDWWHRVLLTRTDVGAPGMPAPWNMFRAFDGRPEWTHWAIDHGIGAWWAEPNVRASFLRPLTAATHMLDYALWPNAPWMMHAQSIAWFVACTALGVALLRRVLGATSWVAGLASVLFTIDPTHGLAVGWIAQRNTLVCTAFGLASILAHERARREKSRLFAIASAAWLALSLAGGEGGAGALGFLFAWAVVLDDASIASRLRSLAPHAMVVASWAAIYRGLGYGARGSAMYLDPVSSPLRFARALMVRGPIALATELGGPPPDGLPFLPERFQIGMLVVAIVVIALGAIVLAPMRRRREVRFFATAALVALLPVCASTPTSRILWFASVGGAALLALMVEAIAREPRSIVARAWTAWTVGTHLTFGAPLLVLYAVSLSFVQRAGDRLAADVPRDASIERLVVANAPDCSFVGMFALVGKLKGEPMPARSICLAPGTRTIEIERIDAHALLVRSPGGFVQNEMDGLVRDPRDPLPKGTRIELTKLVIEITSDVDGRADAATFRFDAPLEDRSLRFLQWDGAHFVDFALPRIGGSVTLAPPSILR
jgi:hypothetical protein